MSYFPKIYAVIVTYNGLRWYEKCFGSLKESTVPIYPIVIDNASTDGSQKYIKDNFKDIHFIESDINHGFAKANNIGIRYAYDNGADYVLLLNQDAWIFHDTIELLLQTFERTTDAGIVSPIHLNGEQTAIDFNFSTNMGGDFVSDCYLGKLKIEYKLPYVNAACWLISRKCIETVGGFDTNLFVHYGEDGDYCRRMIYHKIYLYVCTQAKACHDREYRRNIEDEYRRNTIMPKDVQLKSELSNIIYDVDIDSIIKRTYKRQCIKYIKLKFKELRKIKEELNLYVKIRYSRNINIKPGLNWL